MGLHGASEAGLLLARRLFSRRVSAAVRSSEVLMPDLKTDAQGNVSFKGSKLMSSKGPAHSSLKGVQVAGNSAGLLLGYVLRCVGALQGMPRICVGSQQLSGRRAWLHSQDRQQEALLDYTKIHTSTSA